MSTDRGGPGGPPQVGEILGRTIMTNLAHEALRAAPPFQHHGRWTPMTYSHEERAAAAFDIATAIRLNAHMLTAQERERLARELTDPSSTDHARDLTSFGEPA